MPVLRAVALASVVVGSAACAAGGDLGEVRGTPAPDSFPDVVGVEVVATGDREFRFSVTMSSPYDSPDRYADAWRVMGPDGTVYGVRDLLHDHASEQPFTRSLDGVQIPPGVDTLTVQGRDLLNGWGGGTVEADLP